MENLIGIIASCIATLKPLLRLKTVSDWRSSRSGYLLQSKHRLNLVKPENSSSNVGNQIEIKGRERTSNTSDSPENYIEDPYHIQKITGFEVRGAWGDMKR